MRDSRCFRELRTEIEQRKRNEAREKVKQDLQRIEAPTQSTISEGVYANQFSFALEWEYCQNLLRLKIKTGPVLTFCQWKKFG